MTLLSRQSMCAILISAVIAGISSPGVPTPRFEDVAKQAGLTAVHISTPEKKYIMETMSGGVGFIDCDNDGKLDIVIANGSTVERYRQGGDPMITLYHNDGNLKFSDITRSAGLLRKGWGMGVAVADYDNDGWQDLFVSGYGGNALYHNLGNCKFEDVSEKAGLRGGGFSTGAAWGDFDRDGDVDLFVPGYVHVDMDNLPEFGSKEDSCKVMSVKVQCGPIGLPGEPDYLFHNRGNGAFEDVSKKAGVDDPVHAYGMQGIWFDYDNDGWPDLYVVNDIVPKYLYHNKHDGTFEDVSLISGAAVDRSGKAQSTMGVSTADFDHSGRLGIYITNFNSMSNTLYWNQGNLGFTDISFSSGLGPASMPYVAWGTAFLDMDNDGWVDLFVANGQVYPQADLIKGITGYRQPLMLFRNKRDRTFEDVSKIAGLDKLRAASWRGAAVGDVNNDGKIDILAMDVDGPPVLLINRTESTDHAATFRLIGTKSNRAAIGARMTVTAGALVQLSEIQGGSSYLSQNDLRLHFGLGAHAMMDKVEIRWPNGEIESIANLPADFIYTIVEGTGVQKRAPFETENGAKR
ncbi:MAG: CRTAC1 family protein [Candidatus Acidiferrales bacterium]